MIIGHTSVKYRPYGATLSAIRTSTQGTSLRAAAKRLDIAERTMRRAAAEGLLRGDRPSPRKFTLSRAEEEYLRRHWGLLAALRAGLRTEPAVRLAVLFGSVARGTDHERSDVDVMVDLRGSTPAYVADIAQRLSDRLDREVQLVTLDAAQQAGSLMAAVLEDGRVLVDRETRWPSLIEQAGRWRRVARRERGAFDELPERLDL